MDQSPPPPEPDLPRLPGTAAKPLAARAAETALAHPSPFPPRFEDGDEDTIDLRQYWNIILKRKWTILTFAGIVLVSVMTASFLMTPIYRASMTLQIDREETQVIEYQSVTPSAESSKGIEFYQTQYELLRSRSLALRVIERLNLIEHPLYSGEQVTNRSLIANWMGNLFSAAKDREDREVPTEESTDTQPRNLVEAFLGQLTIEPIRNSRLVKIHFESPDPTLAMRVVSAVSENFINLSLERRVDATSYAKTFLEERLQQTKQKLEESEKALVSFARQEQIVRGSGGDQHSIDTQVMQSFTEALAKAQQERIRTETLYLQMESGNLSGLPMVMESKVIQEFKQLQAKLEAEYQDQLQIFKPGYPKMQQLRGQINEIQAKINEELQSIRAAIRGAYEAALAQEEMLSKRMEETKTAVLNVQDRSIQYNILKREVETNSQLYEGLLQRYKEVGVAGNVGVNNISVVDAAELPGFPVKPNKKRNALIAIVLGLFGGIGLALLFEHLDDTVKNTEDLERLTGLPALGVVPLIARKDDDRSSLIATELANTRSGFAEAYRSLRTALQFSTATGMPKVLMVTSTSPGEGKSTTALALAINLSQAGSKVLLIDADLRKASLHRTMALDNTSGLTNHLAGKLNLLDITRQTSYPGLFVIPAGPLPPNPAELLGGPRMAALLDLARSRFSAVIVDAPPVLGLADAPLLGSIVDGAAMVVEAGATRKDLLFGSLKRLAATRTHVLGCVLTKLDTRSGSYGYYYYNSYYHYHDDKALQQTS